MISFDITEYDDNKNENLLNFSQNDEKARVLIAKIKEEFASSSVMGTPEDHPYISVNCARLREKRTDGVIPAASFGSSFNFSADVRKELVKFIDKNK